MTNIQKKSYTCWQKQRNAFVKIQSFNEGSRRVSSSGGNGYVSNIPSRYFSVVSLSATGLTAELYLLLYSCRSVSTSWWPSCVASSIGVLPHLEEIKVISIFKVSVTLPVIWLMYNNILLTQKYFTIYFCSVISLFNIVLLYFTVLN